MEVKNQLIQPISNLKSVERRIKRNLKIVLETTTKVDVPTTTESKTKTKKAMNSPNLKNRKIQMLYQTWA
jgi:hypothetical protein